MSLEEKLAAQRERSKQKQPAEIRAVFMNFIQTLSKSGMVERALKVGAKAPDFTMKNQNGVDISLSTLLTKGPVVLSIYRGKW